MRLLPPAPVRTGARMENMMKGLLVIGVLGLVGGCGKKGNDELGRTAKTPAAFDTWMPKTAVTAWEGAWSTRLTLSLTGKTSLAGDPVAIDIHGSKARAFDGKQEHVVRFSVHAPCAVQFAQPIQVEGSVNGGTAYHGTQFLIDNGKLIVGRGAAGYRKGKAAVVCSEGRNAGVHILDANGVCTTWQDWFDRWESKPQTCTWSRRDGQDVLTIGTGEWAPELVARGNLLESEQFQQYAAEDYHQREKDYAAAKAVIPARLRDAVTVGGTRVW